MAYDKMVNIDEVLECIKNYSKVNNLTEIELKACMDILCLLVSNFCYKGW